MVGSVGELERYLAVGVRGGAEVTTCYKKIGFWGYPLLKCCFCRTFFGVNIPQKIPNILGKMFLIYEVNITHIWGKISGKKHKRGTNGTQ